MSRLIDADALMSAVMAQDVVDKSVAKRLILQAPTVDAVPVVWCKDCEYYGEDGDSVMDGIYKRCSICGKWHTGSWYCASGERKSNEAD